MGWLIGTVGLEPRVAYRLTPKEIDAVATGYRERVRHMALAAGAGFSGKLDMVDRYFGITTPSGATTFEEYQALKQKMGYA